MFHYCLYGWKISSMMEFPQLIINNEKTEDDIVITEGGIPREILDAAEYQFYSISDSVSWFQNDTGVFYVLDGKEIHYVLRKEANLQYARTYILGYAISMLLLQKGIMTVHCSAIADDDGAILIAGQSGAGKSTITTSFLNKGYKLLADDIAAVGIIKDKRVMAYPAFPFQKLCRDSVAKENINISELLYIDEDKDKFLVPRSEQFLNQPVEVKAMVILGIKEGTKLEVDEIVGVNKLIAIRENLFLRRFRGEWLTNPKVVHTCLEIGSMIPIYSIVRPQQFDTRMELKKSLETVIG